MNRGGGFQQEEPNRDQGIRILLILPLLLTANAATATERLGIFVRVTDAEDRPTGLDQLAVLEQLASRAEFTLGLTVVRASELLTSDVRRSVIECGENLSCIAAKLTAAEIDLGLLATIDASSDPALVLVLLIDAKTGKSAGRMFEESPRNDPDAIARLAEANALRLIIASGHAIGGRALVRATPSDAAITLRTTGIEMAAKSDEKISLAPGKWLVELSKPGFIPKTIELEVIAGKDTELSVELEAESSVLSSPWLWIAVGAVVAGAAITVVAVAGQGDGPPLITGDDGRVIETLRAKF
jgi:hypothetical protein